MAAQLNIHLRTEEIDEDVLRGFFGSTLGSPYFGQERLSEYDFMEAFDIVAETPSVVVGDVSNLKAGLTGDRDRYVPGPAQAIQDEIGSEPVEATGELIERIETAKDDANESIYDDHNIDGAIEFLREHEGEEVFTVSW